MTKEAFKLALEVLENIKNDPFKFDLKNDIDKAIIAIKKVLAQPEQDFVVFNTLTSLKHKKTVGPIESAMMNITPPQRTWVGLTHEEIDKIYEAHHNQYGECESVNFGYERAIESKLKEKNELR